MYKIEDLQAQVRQPGIYFKMSNEDYHNDKSLSNSGMGKLLNNPQKFYDASPLNPGREAPDTKTLKRGRQFHTLFLEPEIFFDEWGIKSNPAGKKPLQTTTEEGMIGEGDYKDMKCAIDKFKRDEKLNYLFDNGFSEVSIFWVDEKTGVPCRARIDKLGLIFTLDAKTTRDCSPNSLKFSIPDYGYHRQNAMYLVAIEKLKQLIRDGKAIIDNCPDNEWMAIFLTTVHDKFVFSFHELTRPYIYRADQLCQATIDAGMAEYRAACHEFKRYYEEFGEAEWPHGYEGQVGLIQRDDLRFKNDY